MRRSRRRLSAGRGRCDAKTWVASLRERAGTPPSWTRPPTPTWSTARGFRSWRPRSRPARSAADRLSFGGLCEHAAPEPNVLTLVAHPALEREPHAIRHVVPAEHLLVGSEPALVAFELRPRKGFGVGATEEFQQSRITKLVHVGLRVRAPLAKRLATGRREAV